LKNIKLELMKNKLCVLVGSTGSGKTSLLMTILQEIPNTTGDIKVNGNVFYVSQEPWIFSGTVRQNITFGKEYEREKFDRIIDACALRAVGFLESL
jgi:ATP-binding cassette subfamily C (CFTR/MRP) protein 4